MKQDIHFIHFISQWGNLKTLAAALHITANVQTAIINQCTDRLGLKEALSKNICR